MKLYFATSNKNKVHELETFLKNNGIDLELDIFDRDVLEPASESLEEIAIYKAELAMRELKAPVMAEDTGIFIHSLNGFPGTFAKYTLQKIGNEGILKLLEGKPRKATFRTAIALATPDKKTMTFVGEFDGLISQEPKGTHGWGHDPIFIPAGSTKTWAEDYHAKINDNQRARALQKLVDYLKSNPFKA